MQVVDGNQQRAALLELAQRVEDRKPDRVRLRRIVLRLGQEQRDLERSAARRREQARDVPESAREQLREPREREPNLGLKTATEEHARAPGLRLVERGFEKCGLADPWLTGDDEGCGAGEDLGEKDFQ